MISIRSMQNWLNWYVQLNNLSIISMRKCGWRGQTTDCPRFFPGKGYLMSKLKKCLGSIVKLEQNICCILLIGMLTVCFGAVVMRYVFSKPLVWSEEVIMTMLIWFGFLCISIGAYDDSHIGIEGLYNMMPASGKKICDILRHLFLMIVGGLMVYFGWKVFKINLLKRLPASHWPQGIQYFPMVFGGFLTTVYSVVNLIECFTAKKNSDKEEL